MPDSSTATGNAERQDKQGGAQDSGLAGRAGGMMMMNTRGARGGIH